VTPISAAYGGTRDLSATLTRTADGTPIAGKTIAFSLNGASVGSAITNANGVASLAGVNLSGNPTGIKARFAGDAIFNPISGIAQLSINPAAPWPQLGEGQAATGAGWYQLADRGRVNFSFNVNQIPKTDPVKYKGEILLINNGRWRLKGSLDYYRYSDSEGVAFGKGQLSYWDNASSKGQGGWVLLGDNVGFGINFVDVNTGNQKDSLSRDKFGINISIDIPEGAPPLPNSSPAELEGGNIDIKDLTKAVTPLGGA
jgi:hypothetical protein